MMGSNSHRKQNSILTRNPVESFLQGRCAGLPAPSIEHGTPCQACDAKVRACRTTSTRRTPRRRSGARRAREPCPASVGSALSSSHVERHRHHSPGGRRQPLSEIARTYWSGCLACHSDPGSGASVSLTSVRDHVCSARPGATNSRQTSPPRKWYSQMRRGSCLPPVDQCRVVRIV